MRIGIASMGDPSSVETWSGIPFSILSALRKRGHEVVPIFLNRPPEPWHYQWLRRYYHRVHGKWFLGAVEERWLKMVSQQLDRKVDEAKPEVVLVIHGDWLAYATFSCPACIIHDTTFASILNYYPSFTNLTSRSIRMGHRMYAKALGRSAAAVFSADWASRSAVHQYGVPGSSVHTIPFGANMDSVPGEADVRKWIKERMRTKSCNLVFLGTQWHRKGGPEALEFLRILHESGVRSTLTIVGCTPVIPPALRKFVRVEGYLNKRLASDREKLQRIMIQSHALIVLSASECYGCVYCEANAFGLPALGRDTGGVPEIIRDGRNGILLRAGEPIEKFAERWTGIWQEPGTYEAMSRKAFTEYRDRLNYDAFAGRLEPVLASLVHNANRN